MDSEIINKENILEFVKKIIPDNFQCKHLSLKFGDDGNTALLIMTNEEPEDGSEKK